MLLYLAIIALTLAVLWIRRRYSYWKDRRVAYVPPTFPAGNLRGMGRKEHLSAMMERCYRKLKGSGPFGGIFFFTNPVAIALELDFVKNVLVKDFQFFHDRSVYHNEEDDPLSGNLFAMEGAKWKNLRAKLTPTFTSGKMKMMFPTIIAVAEEFEKLLTQEIARGSEIEMKEILARFTTDVIGSCAFGLECNSLHDPDAQFRKMGKKAFDAGFFRFFKIIAAQQFRTVARALHVTTTDPTVSNFFTGAVKDTVEYREKHKIERNDFMNLLIKLKNMETLDEDDANNMGALTLEEISAQAFVFFLAGFETSSTAMSYCLYELAVNQELQEKARKDVLESLKKYGSMTYDAVQDMHYVDNCISESLRKYPPVSNLTRSVSKAYQVPNTNCVLEKGLTVIVPVYGLHHDPEYYPDPEKYDPDRFSPEEVAKRNPYCYIPFGEGPRICIGMRFGLMQARVGMAYMLKNFRFTLSSKTPVPLKISSNSLVLTSEGGLWLRVERL
ncbi:probable cytochrome P450 6a13 [Toxorhynchites rutilus septentrionalis]|uniref:probable cytochrome P450 6a13 n=1 Tax=Toxorhynchites rutilus septentrionalis TaxID=329112 RepID=UPI0024789588|nr:probable cytochrome P450 6a13 [Toxorhynchites rutilus septentrionalis]